MNLATLTRRDTPATLYIHAKRYPNLQGSGHLLDVIGAVGVEDVADLKHLEGLLDLTLVPQNQPLDVICHSHKVLVHQGTG